MSEPRVVHVNDRIEGAVYIGRADARHRRGRSPFANPFTVKQYTRPGAIAQYRKWLVMQLERGDPQFIEELIGLRGKPLACWCRHDGEPRTADNACHGDILVSLLEQFTDEELRNMASSPELTSHD